MAQSDRLLPLPYLPTYIARRPAKKINANEDLPARPYEPLFALDWQKSSKTNLMYNRTPFIEVEPDWLFSWSKQYDSYKNYYHEIGIPLPPVISTDPNHEIPSLEGPNHLTQTSQKWSRFLDEYPDRFQIDYGKSKDENDMSVPNYSWLARRPGRHPYRTEIESLDLAVGHPTRIAPAVNIYRQQDKTDPSSNNRPRWYP